METTISKVLILNGPHDVFVAAVVIRKPLIERILLRM